MGGSLTGWSSTYKSYNLDLLNNYYQNWLAFADFKRSILSWVHKDNNHVHTLHIPLCQWKAVYV